MVDLVGYIKANNTITVAPIAGYGVPGRDDQAAARAGLQSTRRDHARASVARGQTDEGGGQGTVVDY